MLVDRRPANEEISGNKALKGADRERLARASLAIREEGSNASRVGVIYQRFDEVIVQSLGVLRGPVNTVQIVLGRLALLVSLWIMGARGGQN
jgi:hypothetical protein